MSKFSYSHDAIRERTCYAYSRKERGLFTGHCTVGTECTGKALIKEDLLFFHFNLLFLEGEGGKNNAEKKYTD